MFPVLVHPNLASVTVAIQADRPLDSQLFQFSMCRPSAFEGSRKRNHIAWPRLHVHENQTIQPMRTVCYGSVSRDVSITGLKKKKTSKTP